MIELFAIHILPLLFCLLAMGWYPCCGGGGECPHCSGNAPLELQVDIAGLADGATCTECDENMNGTFVLSYVGEISNQCCWDYEGGDFCSWDRLRCCVIDSGGTLTLSVSYQDSAGYSAVNIVWDDDLGAYPPNCTAWSDYDLPVTTQFQTDCNDDSSTCKSNRPLDCPFQERDGKFICPQCGDVRDRFIRRNCPKAALPPGAGDTLARFFTALGFRKKKGLRLRKTPRRAQPLVAVQRDDVAQQVTACITAYQRPAALARLLASLNRYWPELRVEVEDTGGNLSAGRNRLVERCGTPFALILEDDFEFTGETHLEPLLAILKSDCEIAGAGGSVVEHGRLRYWCHNFDCFRGAANMVPSWYEPMILSQVPSSKLDVARSMFEIQSSHLVYRPCHALLNFGIFRRSVLRQHPWDEDLPINGEHREWFYRLWRGGRWRFAWTCSSRILHHRDRPAGYETDRGRTFLHLAEAKHGLRFAAPESRKRKEESGRKNIVVLGMGHANTSITTRQLAALCWNLGDADEEFAESVRIRAANQRLLKSEIINLRSEMDAALAALPEPWAIKDPRFVDTLHRWRDALAPYQPLLLWVTKETLQVVESYQRRGKNLAQAAAIVADKQTKAAAQYHAWPWSKLQVDAAQVRAAVKLFDLQR